MLLYHYKEQVATAGNYIYIVSYCSFILSMGGHNLMSVYLAEITKLSFDMLSTCSGRRDEIRLTVFTCIIVIIQGIKTTRTTQCNEIEMSLSLKKKEKVESVSFFFYELVSKGLEPRKMEMS